jgi:hypothetical protein
MQINEDIRREFKEIMDAARQVSAEVGDEVAAILREGRKSPLSQEDACRLLARVITVLKQSAAAHGDGKAAESLDGHVDRLVKQVVEARSRLGTQGQRPAPGGSQPVLVARNGIKPGPVHPKPCFHGREIPMNAGFIKTTDIELWDKNERLDIHLGQFRQKYGREPLSDELLDIMLSKMKLPGISDGDQFQIVALARSIAINGVRKPPILDTDLTLLDGNRRVAACRYILANPEFDLAEKARAEYIFVWQLTEHTTDDDRSAVVVSLNFEPDCKIDWPEYVKARKVYEAWQAMLTLESRSPGAKRQAEMKRELSKKFALGPDTGTINRYLKMVDWADEFEDYHIGEKGRDTYEVKHKANEYFQYFDEIAKGAQPGGVAHALGQDDAFKHLVFDLLFDGKFKNWRQIRELKLIYESDEARDSLNKARTESDPDLAEELLENAISIARTRKAEMREVGANTRIEAFVKWLEELPVRAFRDAIRPENLRKLLRALKLVEKHAAAILGKEE